METKAVINGERIECGVCGALLAKRKYTNDVITDKLHEGDFVKAYEENGITTSIEIKCNHKDKGKKCGAINKILL